jgi:hypothetical protein
MRSRSTTPLPRDYSSIDTEDDERVSFVNVYLKEFGGAFIWVLLLEWKHKFRPTKIGVDTQIKNRGLDLGSTGVALMCQLGSLIRFYT